MANKDKNVSSVDDTFKAQMMKDLRYVSDFEKQIETVMKRIGKLQANENSIKKGKKELEEIKKTVQEVEELWKNIKPIKITLEVKKSVQETIKKDFEALGSNKVIKSINKPVNSAKQFIESMPDKWDKFKDSMNNNKAFKLIRKPIEYTIKTKKMLEKVKVYVLNNDKVLKRVAETKKAVNELKKNVAITIGAKNVAKESINNIKKDLKSIVSKPYNAIIKVKDQTKNAINAIKNNMSKLGIDEAMKREDSFMSFKTSFKNEKDANDAFGWANNQGVNDTQFKASEVRDSVAKLAANGLDYKTYFTPLGNLATANNKSMNEAIEAMSKLSGGNLKDATIDFTKLGITKDMWQKQGIKVDKDGVIQSDSKQAMDAAVKIMDSNWGGAMKNKSNTATGQIKNIKEVILGLGTSLVGMNDNGEIEKGGVFDTFKQQLSNVLRLLGEFKKSDAFKVIKKDLNALVEVAGNKFSKFMENLMRDPDKLNKTFNKLGRSISFVISVIGKMGSVISKYPKTVIGLFAAFKIGIPVISSVVTAFVKFKDIKKNVELLNTSIKIFTTGAKGSLSSLFKVITKSPITLVILAVIGLIILLYKAWTENWGGIRDKTKEVMDKVNSAIKSVEEIVESVKKKVETFVKDCVSFWENLKKNFHPIDAIVNFIKKDSLADKYNADPTKKNALGTSYFSGGWTWIGEQGPELMKLPGGTQILDNRTSQNMLGGSVSVGKLADTLVVREDADIDRIADALAKKLTKVGFNCV